VKILKHFILIAATLATTSATFAQGTAFTYQGQLKNGGSPVAGNVNMTFKLFDALAAGTQQGSTLTQNGLSVTNGLFTTQLDFGVNPYTANQARWLEVAVEGQTLSPRQPLTPAPFALNTRGINVDGTGRVGIGTAAPTAKLQIAGTPGVDGIKFPDGTTQVTAPAGGPGFWSASGSNIFNNNTGNVGIGASAPGAKLHVSSTTVNATDNTAVFVASGIGGNASHIHYGTTGDWYIRSALAGGKVVLQDFGGNVGIGTTAPAFPLTIGTSFPAYGWVHTDGTRQIGSYVDASGGWLGTKSNHALNFFTNDSTARMTLGTSGALGIGTTSPIAKLHLREANASVSHLIESGGSTNAWSRVAFANPNGQWEIGTSRSFNNDEFYIYRTGSPAIAFGVQTNGNAYVQGTLTCKVLAITGADVAEKFPCSEAKPEPGAVMEVDPRNPGKLRLARSAYSTRVAGVVSGAGDLPAGAVLGHLRESEDGPPIALSGRVYVNCDAGNAAIEPGDLLTTSDTAGHAMKAIDRERSHGAILGKAMTRLKRDERGLVLVLVSLQ